MLIFLSRKLWANNKNLKVQFDFKFKNPHPQGAGFFIGALLVSVLF